MRTGYLGPLRGVAGETGCLRPLGEALGVPCGMLRRVPGGLCLFEWRGGDQAASIPHGKWGAPGRPSPLVVVAEVPSAPQDRPWQRCDCCTGLPAQVRPSGNPQTPRTPQPHVDPADPPVPPQAPWPRWAPCARSAPAPPGTVTVSMAVPPPWGLSSHPRALWGGHSYPLPTEYVNIREPAMDMRSITDRAAQTLLWTELVRGETSLTLLICGVTPPPKYALTPLSPSQAWP